MGLVAIAAVQRYFTLQPFTEMTFDFLWVQRMGKRQVLTDKLRTIEYMIGGRTMA